MATKTLAVLTGPTPLQFLRLEPRFDRADAEFSWTEPGEVLALSMPCDGGAWDDRCGCRRALCGLRSSKATTLGIVRALPEADVIAALDNSTLLKGWTTGFGTDEDHRAIRDGFLADIRLLDKAIRDLKVGPGAFVQVRIHDTTIDVDVAQQKRPARRRRDAATISA